jgi:hypothetical protein
MAFSTQTWGGWDYMPRAWPRWIDAPDGVLLVGVVGGDGTIDAEGATLAAGTVVAVVRLAMPAAGEAWLEGIRVEPRVRATDVATDLQVAELHWAAANGARIVRYATSARNEGSMRLGARGGFELITRLPGVSWDAPAPAGAAAGTDHGNHDPSGFDPQAQAEARRRRRALLDRLAERGMVATEGRSGELWTMLDRDEGFNAAARMYEPRPWALEELTNAKFAAHAGRGEVVVSDGEDGTAAAIVVADVAPAEDAAIRLSVLGGAPRAAFNLVDTARQLAETGIRFRHAHDAPLVAAVEQLYRDAGYTFSEWPLHILARDIDAAHPVPPLDSSALNLLDPPGAVITPAQ